MARRIHFDGNRTGGAGQDEMGWGEMAWNELKEQARKGICLDRAI